MAKLGFKDFLNVDYAPGEDDLVKKNAKKRKQEGIDIVAANARKRRMQEDVEPLDEVLSTQQRLKKARKMKILAPRIALGRKRQAKRAADPARLKRRAAKAARNAVFKKLSKGVSRSDMSPARRAEIEKRLNKAKQRIDRLAIRLLPKVRMMDRDRRSKSKAKDDSDSKK